MLKKKIEYKDYMGQQRSKILYFHISMTDAQRMILKESTLVGDESGDMDKAEVRDGLSARIQGVMDRGQGAEMLELFDWLVSNAYGIIEDDGETFAKSTEIYEKWTRTASYDAFFNKLMMSTEMMTEFINGIFPEELRGDDQKLDPEFARHREALASRENPTV